MFLPFFSAILLQTTSWFACTLQIWVMTQISFTVVGCVVFRLFPSIRSCAFSSNLPLPKLLRVFQETILPQIQIYDHFVLVWAFVVAYTLTNSFMTLVGSMLWTYLFSVGYGSIMRASINTFNLAPRFTTTALGLAKKCTIVKESLSEMPKFVFCGGAMGMLESEDLKVKLCMHHHIRAMTEDFDAIDDWVELMAYHNDGDLVMKAEKLSTCFKLKYMASWHEAYLIVSLAWRLGRLSRPTIQACMWILGCCPKSVRIWTTEFTVEMALLMAFETVLANLEEVEMGKGCSPENPVFHTDSVNVVTPVQRSKCPFFAGNEKKDGAYTIYDTRHTNIFGGGRSFCPGRFFVGKLYLAQPKFACPGSYAADTSRQQSTPNNSQIKKFLLM